MGSVSSEAAVLAANQAFYEAFAERNASTMERLWAREHVVACIHPGWAPLHGSDAVIGSWRAILGSPEAPDVACSDATALVIGDIAFVTCIEHVRDGKLAATNVFALERGEWRVVHHHAGPMANRSVSRRPPASPLN
jgi:ketosteroid isomerase-like protein